MATGIGKAERRGLAAIVASDQRRDNPLPPHGHEAHLSYANKSPEDVVLAGPMAEVGTFDQGHFTASGALQPNLLIACDNLSAMRTLALRHAGKVTLIYTDPPYGTGLGFQSRGLRHAYDDHHGDAAYIEFIRRRMIVARQLLSDEGSIYVHIGHQMVAELKIVMDEIFGRENFRNIIARRKCSSKNYTRNSYPNLLDFVLFYSKSKNYVWNRPTSEPSAEWIKKEYPKSDARGIYKLVPIHAPGVRNGSTGESWRGMMPPPGKHWQFTPDKLDALDKAGEIYWSRNGNPRRKVYLEEGKGVPMTDYWPDYRDAHNQTVAITGYPTEKNLDMVKKIVSASSNPGDIVLDPFAGSGTTLHAADDLSRRWIGIDQSMTAIEATVRRLAFGVSRMGDFLGTMTTTIDQTTPNRSFELAFDTRLLDEHRSEVERLAKLKDQPLLASRK